LNLVNLFLWVFGPMTEGVLCIALLGMQIACCVLGVLGKHHLANWLYDVHPAAGAAAAAAATGAV
jgi:hypothetical protein